MDHGDANGAVGMPGFRLKRRTLPVRPVHLTCVTPSLLQQVCRSDWSRKLDGSEASHAALSA